MNHFLGKEQKKIINLSKNYIKIKKNKGIKTELSPVCFMTTWAFTHGFYKLRSLKNENRLKGLIFFIKNIFFIGFNHDYFLDQSNKKNHENENKKIITVVSYCRISDFDNKGNYFDKFLNINNVDYPNYIWFLISLDNVSPKTINKNIFILRKKKNKSYNFFFFLKTVLFYIFKFNFSLKKIYHYLSQVYNFSEIASNKFRSLIIKKKNISSILMSYEAVPYQNGIFNEAKKINKKIKNIGYLHCAPWPIQTDLIFRDKIIDLLAVSGSDQKNVLVKYLSWPKNKIFTIPSLRFKRKKLNDFENDIFVPYELFDVQQHFNQFKIYLASLNNKTLNKLRVRIHPLNQNSNKHKIFKIKLEKLLIIFNKKFSNKSKKKISVFFGPATGSIVQALEKNTDVVHFPNDPLLDTFTSQIWPSIKVSRIGELVFIYSLRKKNAMFLTNYNKNNYNDYLLPKIIK